MLLAGLILRPIHVINSGLVKLQRGEKVGDIDLPPDEELEGVGESFRAISEKLAARSLGRLMAGVTHEVRNPLNAMTIHLELVREHLLRLQRSSRAPVGAVLGLEGRVEEPPHDVSGAREHLDVIASEIKRLDEVITGFVRFIRPEELQLQPVSVHSMVTEVIALVDPDARRSGIVCKAEVSNVGELQADPALLRQALLNLALNGIQAMPNGGKLTMGAKTTKDRRVSLTIEDTGVGISADKLDRIFDLYYTTKPEGSGIGLSIVYRIVQLHGGEIEVQSIEGRGTTFRLLLPQT
jgi:signal transduction histidine kinase